MSSAEPADRGRPPDGARLDLYPNPLRQVFSASTWRSAAYLASFALAVGWILFGLILAATVTVAVLAITLLGIPLLIGVAGLVRGCANIERWRLRLAFSRPVQGSYRQVSGPGVTAQVTQRWSDPATWRDVAYLGGLSVPLIAVDLVVLIAWLASIAGIGLPIWYRYAGESAGEHIYHGIMFGNLGPDGPFGAGSAGFWVGSLPAALLAAAGFLVMFVLLTYLLVITARMHALVARALLTAHADPLDEARNVLARPGPLGPLSPTSG